MGKIKNWMSSQYAQHLRVWRLLKKPTMQEFIMISKVSAIGLLVIGAIGFVISVGMNFIF